jgi:hypothetical protein
MLLTIGVERLRAFSSRPLHGSAAQTPPSSQSAALANAATGRRPIAIFPPA